MQDEWYIKIGQSVCPFKHKTLGCGALIGVFKDCVKDDCPIRIGD